MALKATQRHTLPLNPPPPSRGREEVNKGGQLSPACHSQGADRQPQGKNDLLQVIRQHLEKALMETKTFLPMEEVCLVFPGPAGLLKGVGLSLAYGP